MIYINLLTASPLPGERKGGKGQAQRFRATGEKKGRNNLKVISQQTKNFCKLRSFKIVMHDRIIPKVPKEKMGWSPFLRKGARLQFPFVQTCFPNLRSVAQPDSGLTESKQKQYRAIWKIFQNYRQFQKKSSPWIFCAEVHKKFNLHFRFARLRNTWRLRCGFQIWWAIFLLHILDKMGKTEWQVDQMKICQNCKSKVDK